MGRSGLYAIQKSHQINEYRLLPILPLKIVILAIDSRPASRTANHPVGGDNRGDLGHTSR
jgi:hypothetical protein